MDIYKFSNWLTEEMGRQKLSQADLSRSSGLSVAQISRIVNNRSEPSKDALIAIARGLRLPIEIVFQKANIFSANLPPDARVDPTTTELATIALSLGKDQRELLLDIARLMYQRK
jgi:transcriptional regulator with XRE-family HTH domain